MRFSGFSTTGKFLPKDLMLPLIKPKYIKSIYQNNTMFSTFCVQNVSCNIFYLSAGGIAGAARKISPKASGATTPAKGIAGK